MIDVMGSKWSNRPNFGFTVVELIVVIVVIGALAATAIIGYGSWRANALTAQIKSDLNSVAAAMESYRTFNNGYPTAIPTTVTPADGSNLAINPLSTTSVYCVDGTISGDSSIAFYVASDTATKGPQQGTCASRPAAPNPPNKPTSLVATTVSNSQINLTWVAPTGTGITYTIQRSPDSSFVYVEAEASGVTGTSRSSTGLTSGTVYYYRIKAQNSGGSSGWSSNATATTPGITAPTGLALTSVSTSQINQTWNAVGGTGVTYTIQRATNAAFTTDFGQAAGITATSRSSTGLNDDTVYFYRIRATDSGGTSGWSPVVSIATQAHTCTETSQYGTYPACYDYDSLPIATSIQGYWTTVPDGYLLEDGSAVSRTTYADLYAAIGTTYGAGNGSTTFNLPDSRGRLAVNRSSTDTEFDVIGEKYGEKTHVTTAAEMPSHAHQQYVTANTGGGAVRNDYSADANGGIYPQGLNGGGAGSSAARNNVQPSIVKKFAIKFRAPTGSVSQVVPGTSLDGYWSSAPTGYLLEDGSAVSRTTYADLYAAIGTTYGAGNGSTTFNLPDSRGRTKVNLNTSDSQFASMGLKYGEKAHVMTLSEMASHSHAQYVTANSGGGAVRNDYSSDAAGGTYDQGIQNGGAGGGQAQNVIQPSIVKVSAIRFASTAAPDTDTGLKTASSIAGYWTTAPSGYLFEDGSAVSRTTYADLFAIIGTTHGAGNGSTTFNLPDSRGRATVNQSSDAEFDTIGEKSGEKAHVLTLAELPSHSHAQYVTALSGGSAIRNDYKSDASGGTYSQGLNGGGAGGSAAMNIIQPSITVRYAIKF